MNPQFRQALIEKDYEAVESFLKNDEALNPQSLRDQNISPFLIAAILQTQSPNMARALLTAHFSPDGAFFLDSINAPLCILMSDVKTRTMGVGMIYGPVVAAIFEEIECALPSGMSEQHLSIMRADFFLSHFYENLARLVPEVGNLITDSFMNHSPVAEEVKHCRFLGSFEFNYKLLKSLGITDEVIRLRNREVIDAQISVGHPKNHVLSLCQGTDQFDLEYMAKIIEHKARFFSDKGVITLKNDGERRDLALYIATHVQWDQPEWLAKCVVNLMPKAVKPVDVKGADTVKIMGYLIDNIDNMTLKHMMIRKLAVNPLISSGHIGSLLGSYKDYAHVRDSGRFNLSELLNAAPPHIQAQQLESDLGL
jgi:hypothetical protein